MRTLAHLADIRFGRTDERIAERLVAVVNGLEPDLIAVSGDLTEGARPDQFARARAFLNALKYPQVVVPGRRDVPRLNVAARLLWPLRRYTEYITPDLAPVHRDEELVVIGIDTVRGGAWRAGRLDARRLDAVMTALAHPSGAATRVIVAHHPFRLGSGVGHVQPIGRTRGALAKLAAAGADLFLAGHLNVNRIDRSAARCEVDGHAALVVQAGTVATDNHGEAAAFNVLRIEHPLVTIERFVWDADAKRFASAEADMFHRTPEGWQPSA